MTLRDREVGKEKEGKQDNSLEWWAHKLFKWADGVGRQILLWGEGAFERYEMLFYISPVVDRIVSVELPDIGTQVTICVRG